MRRITVLLTLVLLASAGPGCRGVRPHTGLSAAAYQASGPVLSRDHRGEFFLVLPEGQSFGAARHVVIRGQSAQGPAALFYAWPVDDRTARVRSVTADGATMLESQGSAPVDVNLVEVLSTIEDLSTGVGLVEVGADARVDWIGGAPADVDRVVLAATQPAADAGLEGWLLGTGRIAAGRLVEASVDAGTYFVLPDGAASQGEDEQGDSARDAVATVAVDGAPPLPSGLRAVASQRTLRCGEGVSRWETTPVAVEAGAELLLAGCPDAFVVAAAAPRMRNGLSVSLTEDPLRVVGVGGVVEVGVAMAALDALHHAQRGRLLTAASTLPIAAISIGGSNQAARLRRAELVGAAGYLDWARHELIRDADGIHAGGAYYLAKAAGLAGHSVLAEARAADALRRFERFAYVGKDAAEQGRGRAYRLLSDLADRRGDARQALVLARDAAQSYAAAGDEMAAADAELRGATFALQAGEPALAVKLARLARSRFYHGGSPYFSARAELRLAEVFAEAGEVEKAAEMAEYGLLRFRALEAPVGANRARIIAAGLPAGDATGAVPALLAAREQARELGDEVGVALATVALVEEGYWADAGAAAPITEAEAAVLARALELLDDPAARRRLARPLALLCHDDAARGPCQAVTGGGVATLEDPQTLAMLLDWRLHRWNAGSAGPDAEEAARLQALADDSLRLKSPMLAADLRLVAAIAAGWPAGTKGAEAMEAGLTTLRTSVEPAARADALASLAARYASRGFPRVAAVIAEEGAKAAGDAGQPARQRELVWTSIDYLRRSGAWDTVLASLQSAEPVLGGAGAAAAPQLARLLVYRGDAFGRLGRKADAAQAARELEGLLATLDATSQIEARLLQAELAADRGDAEAAHAALARVEEFEQSLKKGEADDETRKLWRGQAALLRGQLAAEGGRAREAASSFRRASDEVAGVLDPRALRVAVDALGGLGVSGDEETSVGEVVDRLEALRAPIGEHAPGLEPRRNAALAELQLARGEAGAAWTLVRQALEEGRPLADDPTGARCLSARAAGLASARSENLKQWLKSCVDAGSPSEAFDAAVLLELAAAPAEPAGQLDPGQKAERLVRAVEPLHGRLSQRDRARLELARELSASSAPDLDRTAALRRELEGATAPRDRVRALTSLVDLLLDAGRPGAAEELLDQHSSAFYGVGEESQQTLVRLRLRAQLKRLRPVDTLNYASRALAETTLTGARERADVYFLMAQNDVLLGRWHHARENLVRAVAGAEEARDSALQRSIRDFARRFTLELPAD